VARHDQHERVSRNRLRHRVRRAGRPQPGGDLAIGPGFAARDAARKFVNPPVEGRDALEIERDIGEIAGLATQQCDNAIDRDLDIERRAHLARPGIKLKQPPSGFDLARLRQLHADHAALAPGDTASPDAGIK
jgi:hypothetical protein